MTEKVNDMVGEPEPDAEFIIVANKTDTIVYTGSKKDVLERAKLIRAADGDIAVFKETKY